LLIAAHPKKQALNTPSAIKLRSDQERSRISFWAGVYEGYLFENAPASTYERYSRAISKFFDYFPDKKLVHEFLRPDVESYKQRRIKEGANPRTVAIELSILRGFWRFLVRMEAALLNPFVGVKVSQKKCSVSQDLQVYEPRNSTSLSCRDEHSR